VVKLHSLVPCPTSLAPAASPAIALSRAVQIPGAAVIVLSRAVQIPVWTTTALADRIPAPATTVRNRASPILGTVVRNQIDPILAIIVLNPIAPMAAVRHSGGIVRRTGPLTVSGETIGPISIVTIAAGSAGSIALIVRAL